MKQKKASIMTLFIALLLIVCSTDSLYAQDPESPFPTYGSGAVHVRIYTDYFCPPCRAMEPQMEPMLKELLKRNAITLTLVDTPFYRNSALYARYFLYALKEENNSSHAFHVRNVLNGAATDKQMTTKERIEELFRSQGIKFAAWEPKPAFDRYNALIKEDKIDATPTCMIIEAGKKDKSVGGPNIVAALKRLL
jgi:protein-disulfide isomerase